jgi:WD40 repeat protein
VSAIVALSSGGWALSGSSDHTVRLWDLHTAECLAQFTADTGIDCVAVAGSRVAIACSEDGTVHILEIRER